MTQQTEVEPMPENMPLNKIYTFAKESSTKVLLPALVNEVIESI
jgi:hypothetical protein